MKKKFQNLFIVVGLLFSFAFAQQEITTTAELERLAPLGGEYRLAAGTYELSEPLLLTKGLSLIGAGMGETVVTGSSPLYVISIESTEHFKLDGISFKYTGTEGSEVLQIKDASFEILNSSFYGGIFAETEDFWYGDGLWIHGNAKGTVSNSIFSDNALNAIALEENVILTVTNSEMRNNGNNENGSTVFATGDTELFLENNSFNNNPNGGFYFSGNTKITAIGNTITNNGDAFAAIVADDNASLNFENNIISDNPLGAISLFGNARLLANSNEFINNGGSTIYAEAEVVLRLNSNLIKDSLGTSVFVLDNAKLEAISNTITNSGIEDTAIVAQDQAEVVLVENTIINNPQGALSLFGSAQGFLEKNQIINNGSNAYVALYAEADTNMYLNDNEIVNSSSGAIFALGNAKVEANGNTIKDSGLEQKAILVAEQASVNFNNNTITDNPLGAVWLYGNAKGNFANNSFSNNGNDDYDSFFIEDQANIVINDNKFVNDYGFSFNENSKAIISKNIIVASQKDDIAAISVYDNSKVEIIKNKIHNGLFWAVFANADTELVLLQNIIQDNYGGLNIGGNVEIRILVNNISNNDNRGINLFGNSNAYVAVNSVLGNTKTGIVVRDNATAQAYKNNFSENLGTGVGIIENAKAIVIDNEIVGNIVNGAVAGEDSWLMLEQNQIAKSPIAIMFLGNAQGSIKNNLITKSEQGIVLKDAVKPAIADNLFEDVAEDIVNE